MSLKTSLDALPAEKWKNDMVYFKKIQSEDDLIYATFECELETYQRDFVNPAWFSIGRAYLAPEDNYPCIICNSNGENIGFINLSRWMGGGEAFSWSYYVEKTCRERAMAEKPLSLRWRYYKVLLMGK